VQLYGDHTPWQHSEDSFRMDEDHNHPDRLRSETPTFATAQQHERTGSMSLGVKPPPTVDDAPAAVNGDAVKTEAPITNQPDPYAEQVNNVINSEVSSYFAPP
jgi:hypothetical protein